MRAAQRQLGRQTDMNSECTGAQSMSTSRRQESGKPQQNGSLDRLEQEAQSARVSLDFPSCTGSTAGPYTGAELHFCQLPYAERTFHSPGLIPIFRKRTSNREGCLQTPGGPENGEASLDGQRSQGDQGRGAVADHSLGENVREASSNGGAHLAPARNAEPVGGRIDECPERIVRCR